MKFKKSLIIFFLLAYFSFIWLLQNNNTIENYISGIFGFSETILILNNSAFGYSSMQAYCLFFVIPYIILVNNFYLENGIYTLIREKNRNIFYIKRFKQIITSAIIISIIHYSVNLLFSIYYFSFENLSNIAFFEIGLLNCVGLIIFYSSVGTIYYIIEDFTSSNNMAFFFTCLLMAALFFIEKLNFNQNWGPIKDLVIFNKMLDHSWGTWDVLFAFIRELLILILLIYIGIVSFNRKDIVKNA